MLIITFSVLLVCFLAAIKFEQFCPLKSFFSTNIKASFAHFYHYTPPYLLVLHIPAYICVLIFIKPNSQLYNLNETPPHLDTIH